MHNPFLVTLAFAAIGVLPACSTQITERGFNVNLVTASSSNQCRLIEMFTVKGSDPDDTLRRALNQAAVLGADSMAVADGKETAGGAEIRGAALICRKP